MANDLVIAVGANIAALERELKASAKVADRAAQQIEDRFRKVNPTISTSALTGALKGFAAAFTLDRIIRGLAEANADLVRIGETAKRVGLDLQRFQELQFAGRQNGLTGKDFGSGLEGLAEKLNEARQAENGLSKLFADNNVKLKDRKGEVIGVNEALAQAANLVRNAATEFDKIKIAEAVGLTKDWVPLLEQGAAAIDRQAAAARAAGVVIDSDIIQKAKEFERDWAVAIERWTTLFKANAGAVIGFIDTIISKAAGLGGMIENALGPYARRVLANEDLRANGVGGASAQSLQTVQDEARSRGTNLDPSVTQRLAELRELERETNRGSAPLEVTVKPDRSGSKTNTSSLFSKKGSGSSSKSEDEQAQARLDRYIESLMRQNSVLDAEIATFGKSNAERRAATELAKAQVDLAKLDDDARAKVIAGLTREIELSEEKRRKLADLKSAQEGLRDAQKFFGEAAVDALEDLIIRGGKAQDVVKNLTAALAKAALQAALLGTGPLAGIFGAKGVDGAAGGLFGEIGKAVFGRATGGPVNAGQIYKVGERGPETFVPTVPGRIIPNRNAGGGVNVTFAIDARGATPDAIAGLRLEMARQQASLPGIIMRTQEQARRRGATR
jgi:hypothetical protein